MSDERRFRVMDADTAVEAGRHADERGTVRAEVVAAHASHPDGLTDDELISIVLDRLQEVCPDCHQWSASGIRKRRSDLLHEGIVRDTGERRASNHGRKMAVWAWVPVGDRVVTETLSPAEVLAEKVRRLDAHQRTAFLSLLVAEGIVGMVVE